MGVVASHARLDVEHATLAYVLSVILVLILAVIVAFRVLVFAGFLILLPAPSAPFFLKPMEIVVFPVQPTANIATLPLVHCVRHTFTLMKIIVSPPVQSIATNAIQQLVIIVKPIIIQREIFAYPVLQIVFIVTLLLVLPYLVLSN